MIGDWLFRATRDGASTPQHTNYFSEFIEFRNRLQRVEATLQLSPVTKRQIFYIKIVNVLHIFIFLFVGDFIWLCRCVHIGFVLLSPGEFYSIFMFSLFVGNKRGNVVRVLCMLFNAVSDVQRAPAEGEEVKKKSIRINRITNNVLSYSACSESNRVGTSAYWVRAPVNATSRRLQYYLYYCRTEYMTRTNFVYCFTAFGAPVRRRWTRFELTNAHTCNAHTSSGNTLFALLFSDSCRRSSGRSSYVCLFKQPWTVANSCDFSTYDISVRRTQTRKTRPERMTCIPYGQSIDPIFFPFLVGAPLNIAWDFSHTHQTAPVHVHTVECIVRLCIAPAHMCVVREYGIVINLSEYYFILVSTMSQRKCAV